MPTGMRRKMASPSLQKLNQNRWLPYFVAILGSLLSILLGYAIWADLDDYFEFLTSIKIYLPWITLLTGIAISVMIGSIIRVGQVAYRSNLILNQANEALKKEINERMSAEEVKQKLEVALLQGQKLQAIGTLAGGIAHDFNNILYAIIGYVEMSREDVDKTTLPYKNLGKVLDAAHRGQELIARILAFSRRQHHQFNELNLTETIEAALSLLRPTIPASVSIEFDPDVDATILGNQTQIHQVLVNLINNAVDAMDGEGNIVIHLSRVTKNDPLLKQFPETQGQNYCKIEVSDTGHGMDQHTMERIFEPFFTTKEVGKGTGLGLSIVHSIIKEHLGQITLISQLGHGTTFTILLPEHK